MEFWYFNIQMLPVLANGEYIGKEGYKKIFEKLNDEISKCWETEDILNRSWVSRKNYHAFKPFSVTVNYASGYISKFDRVTKVVDTIDPTKTLYLAGSSLASSQASDFRFVFDFERHILAIETKKRLPAVSVLKRIISHMLTDIARGLYPDHALHVSLLSDHGLVSEMKKNSSGYCNVKITATFTNSVDGFNEDTQQLENELRDKRVGKVDHSEKASIGSYMLDMTKYAATLLLLSIPSGHALVTYIDSDTGKRAKLNTDQLPVEQTVKVTDEDGKDLSFEEIDLLIAKSIPKAFEKALQSESNIRANQRLVDNSKDGEGNE